MTVQQRYWLEKLELQFTVAMTLAATYFVCWPLVRGADSSGAVSFLADGGLGQTAAFAGVLWGGSVLCAALTASARPSASMAAALIGAGGIAVRSGPIQTLLWNHMSQPAWLFHRLVAELLVLAGLLVVADVIIGTVRWVCRLAMPTWAWRPHLPAATSGLPGKRLLSDSASAMSWLDETCILGPVFSSSGARKSAKGQAGQTRPPAGSGQAGRPAGRQELATAGQALLIAAAVAAGMIACLLRSADRGQIIFALFASFFLASLAGHYACPSRYGSLAVLLPLAFGVAAYLLAGAAGVGATPQGWIDVGLYARALPVDWLTAGSGGAILGCWTSQRMHEAKQLDRQEE